ncbi:hypothetical protein KIPB_010828, partial [Kipferlia bialata]
GIVFGTGQELARREIEMQEAKLDDGVGQALQDLSEAIHTIAKAKLTNSTGAQVKQEAKPKPKAPKAEAGKRRYSILDIGPMDMTDAKEVEADAVDCPVILLSRMWQSLRAATVARALRYVGMGPSAFACVNLKGHAKSQERHFVVGRVLFDDDADAGSLALVRTEVRHLIQELGLAPYQEMFQEDDQVCDGASFDGALRLGAEQSDSEGEVARIRRSNSYDDRRKDPEIKHMCMVSQELVHEPGTNSLKEDVADRVDELIGALLAVCGDLAVRSTISLDGRNELLFVLEYLRSVSAAIGWQSGSTYLVSVVLGGLLRSFVLDQVAMLVRTKNTLLPRHADVVSVYMEMGGVDSETITRLFRGASVPELIYKRIRREEASELARGKLLPVIREELPTSQRNLEDLLEYQRVEAGRHLAALNTAAEYSPEDDVVEAEPEDSWGDAPEGGEAPVATPNPRGGYGFVRNPGPQILFRDTRVSEDIEIVPAQQ